jgi:hypothetical protein
MDEDPLRHSVRSPERPFGWRRTQTGWEKSHDWWKGEPKRFSVGSRLSPLSVAALEMAVSLAALATLASGEKKIAKKTAP